MNSKGPINYLFKYLNFRLTFPSNMYTLFVPFNFNKSDEHDLSKTMSIGNEISLEIVVCSNFITPIALKL